jgi:hypothetical protein
MSKEIVEQLVNDLAQEIRALAPELAKCEIEGEGVESVRSYLEDQINLMAIDLQVLLAAAGKTVRKFELGKIVPVTPIAAPSPTPQARLIPTPEQRKRFQGRLVKDAGGTPLLATEEEPRPVVEAEAPDVTVTDVGFIEDN